MWRAANLATKQNANSPGGRATPSEVEEYKRFVWTVAQAVAGAPRLHWAIHRQPEALPAKFSDRETVWTEHLNVPGGLGDAGELGVCILVIVLMGIVLTSLSLRTIATYDR